MAKHANPDSAPADPVVVHKRCYRCGQDAEHQCCNCGRQCCNTHGGWRRGWSDLSRHGWKRLLRRTLLITKLQLCDECTPDPMWLNIQFWFLFTVNAAAVTWLVFYLLWR